MGTHIVDGQFKSDKYAWCPAGFVPLKVTDPMAQPVLWDYAQRRRPVDAEFSADLEVALRAKGFEPPTTDHEARAREMAREIAGPCLCDRMCDVSENAACCTRCVQAHRIEKALLTERDAARDAAVRETREADVAALTQLAAERRATRKPTMDAGTQNRIVTYCGALGDGVNALRGLMPKAEGREEVPMR